MIHGLDHTRPAPAVNRSNLVFTKEEKKIQAKYKRKESERGNFNGVKGQLTPMGRDSCEVCGIKVTGDSRTGFRTMASLYNHRHHRPAKCLKLMENNEEAKTQGKKKKKPLEQERKAASMQEKGEKKTEKKKKKKHSKDPVSKFDFTQLGNPNYERTLAQHIEMKSKKKAEKKAEKKTDKTN